MKKSILPAVLALFTLPACLWPQDSSFDKLYRGVGVQPSVPAAVPAAPVPRAARAAPAPAPAPAARAAGREWLIMVFISGRNNLFPAAIADVNEMETVGSSDTVAITAELGLPADRGVSTRYYIEKDDRFPVADLVGGDQNLSHIVSRGVKVPDADMGSWREFVDFAKWSIRKYPAKKIMAVLWNHGSGRVDIGGADNSGAELGIAYDDATRNFIRNKQIAAALAEIKRSTGRKIDLLDSDACLMQMASVVYELKDLTDVIVGSEETVPNQGLPYDAVLSALTASPNLDAEGLGRLLVDRFRNFYAVNQWRVLSNPMEGAILSAIRTSQLGGFVRVLNAWEREAEKPENAGIFKKAVSDTLAFEHGYDGPDTRSSARSKDLYDFIAQVNVSTSASRALRARGAELQAFIANRLVIHNAVAGPNADYARARGLAVYFPQMIYDGSFDETRFAADSLWDDFLKVKLAREQPGTR